MLKQRDHCKSTFCYIKTEKEKKRNIVKTLLEIHNKKESFN